MAGKPLATFNGTAIRPGVSRNGRLYTRKLIAQAVTRAQERLATPDGMPLTMLTHHDAKDDSTRIVGRVVSLTLERDGSAAYEAVLADTPEARKILELIEPDANGQRFLAGVSIRGFWLGAVRQEIHAGQTVETADDLELDGLDFTRSPGVAGADVDQVFRVESAQPAETTSARAAIHESAPDAPLLLVEASEEKETAMPPSSTATPTPAAIPDRTPYADNGYRDGQKRYRLGTPQEAITAYLAFSDRAVVESYTSQQVKRAKARIARALEAFDLTATGGVVVSAPRPVGENAEVTEYWGGDDGSFYVELTNGAISVRISSWCCPVDQLATVGKAAMDGAVAALLAVDPDLDGHVSTGETADPDDVSETDTPSSDASAAGSSTPAAPDSAVDPTTQETEEPAVSEPTTPAAGTPAAVTLSTDQFQELLAAARGGAPVPAPAEAAAPPPAAQETADQRIARLIAEKVAAATAPVAETEDEKIDRLVQEALARNGAAPAVQETEEQRIDRLVQEKLTAAIQAQAQQGGAPARKGLVAGGATTTAPVGESAAAVTAPDGLPESWPQKPLHLYTEDERQSYLLPAVEAGIMGNRSVVVQQPAAQ
ncbi:hypothetical protein [Saccharothrix hoggarensis]|uniref:HK97 family phage prohead protease n=1 Tax=Saccharothrix hoggarensis TaxID=913853 RepID=A0ABW3QP31_9PSEU